MPKNQTNLIRKPDFKIIYAIGAIGSWTPHDFRINFYSEKVKDKEGEALVNDVQVILPPKAVRDLAVTLTRYIKEYERVHGISLKDIDFSIIGDMAGVKKGAEKTGVNGELISAELKQDLKQDLKKDIEKDLKKDLKQDLKKDITKDLRQDLKKDLKQDLKEGLKKDIETELRKSTGTKLPARGRRRVSRGRKSESK